MAAKGDPVTGIKPFPLNSERLCLRPLAMADMPTMRTLLADPEVTASLAIFSAPPLAHELTGWIASAEADAASGKDFRLGICERASGKLIGNIGLHPDAAQESADFGYWLGHSYWGHGHASEAARLLIAHARDLAPALRRLTATTAMENRASVVLLERLGFHEAGEVTRETAEGRQRRSRYFERSL
jgi:RimJ/RimL family protein N-acetyltransferase